MPQPLTAIEPRSDGYRRLENRTLVSPRDERSSQVLPTQGRRLREREDAWCRSHPEMLQRYADQWVIVEGEAIVVHGRDPVSLVAQARECGVEIPYIFFVEAPQPGVVKLGP